MLWIVCAVVWLLGVLLAAARFGYRKQEPNWGETAGIMLWPVVLGIVAALFVLVVPLIFLGCWLGRQAEVWATGRKVQRMMAEDRDGDRTTGAPAPIPAPGDDGA